MWEYPYAYMYWGIRDIHDLAPRKFWTVRVLLGSYTTILFCFTTLYIFCHMFDFLVF